MAVRILHHSMCSRIAIRFALMAAVCPLTAQETSPAPIPYAEQLRLADGLYSRGLHQLALEEYERLLRLDPPPKELDVIAFRAGECARALGEDARAIPFYLRVVAFGKEGETLIRARLRLAELTFQLERLTSTLAHTRAILKSGAGKEFRVPALYLQGQAQAASKRSEEAVATFQQLISEAPEDPLAAYAALELARNEADPELKKEYFEAVVEDAGSPDLEMEAMWGLFRLAREQNDLEEAARQSWALWKQHPDGARVRQALLTLAWTHLQVGQHARALEVSEAATPAQRKVQPDTWLFLDARCRVALQKPDEAIESLQALLADYPDSRFRSLAAYELAALQAAKGKHAEVLKLAEELKGIPGRERDVDWLLAESARATGKVEEALKRYDALAALSPEASPRVADASFLRALLRDRQGDEDAVTAYTAFVQRFPRDARAPGSLHRAGALARNGGEGSRAYGIWTRALELYPDHPDSLELILQLAMMDAQADRTDLALQRYETAQGMTEEKARLSDITYRMGLLYERTGNAAEAIAAYQKSLAQAPEAQEVMLRLRLGVLLQNREQEEEAVKVLRPLLEASPNALPDSLVLWLFRMSETGEHDLPVLGIADVMTGEDRNDTLRELGFYARARARLKQEDAEGAVQDWTQGLAFKTTSTDAVQARLDLGGLFLEQGKAADAKRLFGEASGMASSLEDGRMQAAAMMRVGDAEMALKRYQEAARMYLGVAVLYQDEDLTPRALQKAAEAYREAGMPDRAEEILLQLGEELPEKD